MGVILSNVSSPNAADNRSATKTVGLVSGLPTKHELRMCEQFGMPGCFDLKIPLDA